MIMTNFQVVQLMPEEWQPYKQLRLEALLLEPQAFSSRYASAIQNPDSYWQGRLVEAQAGQKSWLLFAKENDRLIGMIGAYAEEESDEVGIISVYVTKEKRGQGVATVLMAAILAEVGKKGVFQKAVLTVNADQTPAVALYRHFGFQIVGEEMEIQGDGNSHPSYIMEKALGQAEK